MKRALVKAVLLLAVGLCLHAMAPDKDEGGQALEAVKQTEFADESFSLEVSAEDFRKSILRIYPDAVLEGSPSEWLGEWVQGVGISVGGREISEKAMRQIFILGNRNFELRWTGESFLFEANGVDKSGWEG